VLSRSDRGRRLAWGAVDQLISSATNLLASAIVVRQCGADGFGAFSISFAVYLFATGITRAVVSEPLLVKYSGSLAPSDIQRLGRRGLFVALQLGVVAAVVSAGVGAIVPQVDLKAALLATAVVFPGLLAQDAWRFIVVAQGRPRSAAWNDLLWAAIEVPVLLALINGHVRSVGPYVLAWGAPASLALVLAIASSRSWPSAVSIRTWYREHAALASRFVVEAIAIHGTSQLTIYGVGGVLGLAGLGTIRVAQLAFAPVNLLQNGARIVAIPEAIRARQAGDAPFFRFCVALSVLIACATGVVALSVVLLPASAGQALLGAEWHHARRLLLPAFLERAFLVASVGAFVGLRAMQASNRSMVARVWTELLTTVAGVLGALIGGIEGALYGLAVAQGIGTLLWWVGFRRSMAAGHRSGSTDERVAQAIDASGAVGADQATA
jgi:hypothetical protein